MTKDEYAIYPGAIYARKLSWATMTAAQLRQKIADIEAIPSRAIRDTYARMLGTAVARHAPHHAGLLPPDWIAP